MSTEIPTTYRALQFTSSSDPPSIVTLPTPALTASTALVRPIRSTLFSYSRDIFSNSNARGYHYPLPIVPGSATVGRLLAAASDVPSLKGKEGALVFVDPVVRAVDGSAQILHALNSGPGEAGKALAAEEWRNGSWGEVVRVPGGNVHLLDEERLLLNETWPGLGLGYSVDDLGALGNLMIVYGGLRDVDLRVGETVLVAPGTGSFGGGAVHVALAMGARLVVVMGRNKELLRELEGLTAERGGGSYGGPAGRVKAVEITGDADRDLSGIKEAVIQGGGRKDGTIDVYFDMTPPAGAASSHIKAGIGALRRGGRMSLMGGAAGDVGFPYYQIMVKGLRLQGTWMYKPEYVDEVIGLVEAGRLKLGQERAGTRCLGVFNLEEWEDAFRVAAEGGGAGRFTLFAPNGRDAK